VAARPVFACAHRWRGTVTLARASRRARCLASLGTLRLRRSPIAGTFAAASRAAAPFLAHRRSHRSRHSCMRSCGARLHFARHCLARCAPQCLPLTRRCGFDPPGQPASIFPISRTT